MEDCRLVVSAGFAVAARVAAEHENLPNMIIIMRMVIMIMMLMVMIVMIISRE